MGLFLWVRWPIHRMGTDLRRKRRSRNWRRRWRGIKLSAVSRRLKAHGPPAGGPKLLPAKLLPGIIRLRMFIKEVKIPTLSKKPVQSHDILYKVSLDILYT